MLVNLNNSLALISGTGAAPTHLSRRELALCISQFINMIHEVCLEDKQGDILW